MTPHTTTRRRSVIAALVAVGAAAGLAVAGPSPVSAAPVPVADGELEWGVKTSFRTYIETPFVHGQIATADGATRAGDVFEFPAVSGSFDGGTTVDARFGGSVHFTGHDFGSGPVLNLKFSDLHVVVSGTAGTLYADATYAGDINSGVVPPVLHEDVPVASLDLSAVTPVAAGTLGLRWSNVPATLTAEGVAAFAGFYAAGDALDPVSFTLSGGEVPRYRPLTPARILDTRVGGQTVDHRFEGEGIRAPGSTVQLQVSDRGGVPAGASAVALNVTVAGAQGDGYVTVWPCDSAQPNASSLNFADGQTVANAVIAKVGAGGLVCLYVAEGSTELLADVTGYFPTGSAYTSLTPARLLDTRPGTSTVDGVQPAKDAVAASKVVELPVLGRGGVADDATAVVLNVTVTGPEGRGYVTVYPCGAASPNASSLNFVAGQTVPNAVIAKVGAGGKVCLYVAESATQLIADVTGSFPPGSDYTSLTPARLADTRTGGTTADGKHAGSGARASGTTLELDVVGRGGVPANATTVVLNVTAAGPRGAGYVTVYPCDVPRPNASSLNFVEDRDVPNAVISQIGVGDTVCLYVAEATTDLIVDVVGAFTA